MSADLPIPPESSSFHNSDEFTPAIHAVKALHAQLMSLMTEMAALRRTILDDPDLRDLYEHNLRDAMGTARPILAEAMECYEMMISGADKGKLRK